MSTTITLRPVATGQAGVWSVVGAASAWQALSDNSDSTYVQAVPTCRLPVDVMAVSFGTPSVPAGAQIYSVGVRRRIQTVVGYRIQCCHWFRCNGPLAAITAIIFGIIRFFFGSWCPVQPITAWVEEDLPATTTDPNGNAWTLNSFATLYYEFGKIDQTGTPLRVSEAYLDVVYDQQSTVTVTAPTGTITTTCRPTVQWVYASPDSNPQSAYQVAIYTAAQVGAVGFAPFVSTPEQSTGGWILGEDQQWTLASDIVNGTWYAYVQVQQAWGGAASFVSGVASGSWTQSIAGAPVATLLDATYDPTNYWVKLDFQPGGSSPTTFAYAVQVSRDLGQTWGPVRGGLFLAATGGVQTVYDLEAPIGLVSQYRVLAYGMTGSLYFAASGYSSVLSVTRTGTGDFILSDPLNPLLTTVFPIAYQGDAVTRRRVQGTFEPISGGLTVNKIVVNGPQYGLEGTFQVIFHKNQPADYYAAFLALDGSGHTLRLDYPTGEYHYILFGPGAVGSDESYTWEMDFNASKVKYRKMTISYTEVDSPAITS
jgi:hypothetical protein